MLIPNLRFARPGLILIISITVFCIYYFLSVKHIIVLDYVTFFNKDNTKLNSFHLTSSILSTVSRTNVTGAKFNALIDKNRLAFLYTNMQTIPGRYPNTFVFNNLVNIFATNNPPNNIHPFKVVRNPYPKYIKECDSKSRLLILALVVIGADFFEKRQTIRQTWANRDSTSPSDFRVLFVIGLTSNHQVNAQINLEFQIYGDLLQSDYLDSYWMLTVKVMGAFKWVRECCPTVQYVLRINDHMQVNVFELIKHFKSLSLYMNSTKNNLQAVSDEPRNYENTIWGLVLKSSAVQRDQANKYFVPTEEFGFNYFLPYMEGSALMLSGDLVSTLYNLSTFVNWPRFSVSLEVKIFRFIFWHLNCILKINLSEKDVYIGMLCLHLKANYREFAQHVVTSSDLIHGIKNPEDSYFVHVYSPGEHLEVWQRIKASRNKH
jgi:hypothetical protein